MKKSLTIIIVAMFVVFALALTAVFIVRDISHTGVLVASLTEEAEANDRLHQAMLADKNRTATLAPDIALINSHIVPADGAATFLDSLEQLASSLGLVATVNSVSVDPSKQFTSTDLEYLTIDITVVGSWESVYRFAALTENLPYIINMEAADMSQSVDEHNKPNWRGAFKIGVVKQSSPTETAQ